jgi:hypothetical protein
MAFPNHLIAEEKYQARRVLPLVNLIRESTKRASQGDRVLLAMLRASEPPNKPAR